MRVACSLPMDSSGLFLTIKNTSLQQPETVSHSSVAQGKPRILYPETARGGSDNTGVLIQCDYCVLGIVCCLIIYSPRRTD